MIHAVPAANAATRQSIAMGFIGWIVAGSSATDREHRPRDRHAGRGPEGDDRQDLGEHEAHDRQRAGAERAPDGNVACPLVAARHHKPAHIDAAEHHQQQRRDEHRDREAPLPRVDELRERNDRDRVVWRHLACHRRPGPVGGRWIGRSRPGNHRGLEPLLHDG